MNKILLYGLGIFGFFYVAMPHSVHQKYALDWLLGFNLSHPVHFLIGVVIIGLVYYLYKKYGVK